MDTNTFKYKFCLWKAYFDTGYGMLSMPKYILILLGFGDTIMSQGSNKIRIIILGLVFALVCFLIGWAWFRYDLQEANLEVGNQYNAFVKEMRQSIGKRKNVQP